MAELIVVSWRDIPAQVIVKAGRRSAKRPLSDRFQEAIDRAAMRSQLRETDAYLGEWRRIAAGSCGDDLEAEVVAAAARLEAEYPPERLRALAANGGLEPGTEGTSA
jgi:Virulence factor